MLTSTFRSLPDGGIDVTVLDVGRGVALVIRYSDQTWIYGTGPRWRRGNTGERILIPFLRTLGATSIETLVIASEAKSRVGGVRALREALPIRQLLVGASVRLPITPQQPCQQGQAAAVGGVQLWFLEEDNCSLLLVSNGGRVLVVTDLDSAVAEQLAANNPVSELKADLLLAPSEYALPRELLTAIAPQHVILSTSYKDAQRKSVIELTDYYRSAGATVWITGRDGAVHAGLRANLMPQVRSQRAVEHRYWHSR